MIIVVMLLGGLAVYLLLENIYRKMWNKGLEVNIDFSRKHVSAGETAELVQIVTNRKCLPLSYINVKFQIDKSLIFDDGTQNSFVSDKTYRNDIFSLLMYQKATRTLSVLCTKRGIYTISDMQVVSTGMFMKDVLVMVTPSNAQIVVYPKKLDTGSINVAFRKLMGMVENNSHMYEDPFAFRGIREYTEYDSLNSINWKAFARTGNLMVNEYNETVCQEVCILLNVEPEGMLIREELSETSISIASGLAEMLIEKGIVVSLISNGVNTFSKEPVIVYGASGFSHINTINTSLAGIELRQGQPDFKDILSQYVPKVSNNNVIYCMISQNRRADLQKSFSQYINDSSGCMWIAPCFKGEEAELEYSDLQYYQWEVKHHAKQF